MRLVYIMEVERGRWRWRIYHQVSCHIVQGTDEHGRTGQECEAAREGRRAWNLGESAYLSAVGIRDEPLPEVVGRRKPEKVLGEKGPLVVVCGNSILQENPRRFHKIVIGRPFERASYKKDHSRANRKSRPSRLDLPGQPRYSSRNEAVL